MEESSNRAFTIPGGWQMAWLLGLVSSLGATAFFGTWVGVAVQGGQWGLLSAGTPLFALCSAFLYWLATRVRRVVVGEKSVLLDSAAIEREVDFEEIERIGILPKWRNFQVLIVCKAGGGYRVFTCTREWGDLLAERSGVPIEELSAAPRGGNSGTPPA